MGKALSKIFLWMCVGILTTFFTGFYVSNNPNMLYNIFSTSAYYLIFIAEIILVIFLSARIHKMSFTTALISFLGYAVLSGLTFSCIFVLFEAMSIIYIFALTAVIFIIFALIGFVIRTFKVPEISSFKFTQKTGGEPIDQVILRWIKFKRRGNKIYVYKDEDLNQKEETKDEQ